MCTRTCALFLSDSRHLFSKWIENSHESARGPLAGPLPVVTVASKSRYVTSSDSRLTYLRIYTENFSSSDHHLRPPFPSNFDHIKVSNKLPMDTYSANAAMIHTIRARTTLLPVRKGIISSPNPGSFISSHTTGLISGTTFAALEPCTALKTDLTRMSDNLDFAFEPGIRQTICGYREPSDRSCERAPLLHS